MENIMIGFSNVFQLSNLFICIGGLMVGVLFGALPGFSATMAVAVFVPFTYVMEPGPALPKVKKEKSKAVKVLLYLVALAGTGIGGMILGIIAGTILG